MAGTMPLPVGSTLVAGWTVVLDTVDYVGPYWAAYEGGRSIDLNGITPGGVEQSVATSPGATYLVTFFLAGDPTCGPAVKTVQVSAAGQSATFAFDTTGASLADPRWNAREWMFTAAGTTSTLQFASQTVGACGPAVDGVRVTEIPAGGPVAKVSVKRVVGPAGTVHPRWTDATVENLVAEQDIFFGAACGLTFVLDEIVDVVDPRLPSSWFDMDIVPTGWGSFEVAAEGDPCAFAWRTDAVNVYLVGLLTGPSGPFGGVCSFPGATPTTDDLIVLAPSPPPLAAAWTEGRALAHELGHYFGLYHTNETTLGVEQQGSCQALAPNCASAGDLVCDTPADPFPSGDLAALDSLYGCGSCFGCDSCPYRALRWNPLANFSGTTIDQGRFTPGQGTRILSALFASRTHVLVGGVSAAIASVAPASALYPGPTTVTVAGTDLPTMGTVRLYVSGQAPSSPAGAPTSTAVTATFPSPLPPGFHCVAIRQDDETVAHVSGGVHVRPSARGSILPSPFALSLAFASTIPSAPMAGGFGVPSPVPIPIPGAVYFLDLLPSSILGPVPFLTDAAGDAVFGIAVPPGLSGQEVHVQAAELSGSPIRFTNRVRVIFP
ncbi:MAG: choice-of-anchor C family protein [Planctomycetes bacterium]|nr:choice-of-anchor C family protein [Planctomycetota bacterium]